ncbi:hypothetical protein CHARACLAT_025602 [Characodon lateralis]|uniref:Uncharacterized protein n=1 Tax=Characodon lateralis TaxID=208331 RepID=A0ABU7EMT7_9TELE|nr:hypothetical protein [Characodon lateralis]
MQSKRNSLVDFICVVTMQIISELTLKNLTNPHCHCQTTFGGGRVILWGISLFTGQMRLVIIGGYHNASLPSNMPTLPPQCVSYQKISPESSSKKDGTSCLQSLPHGISLAVMFLPESPTQLHWLTCGKCWLENRMPSHSSV